MQFKNLFYEIKKLLPFIRRLSLNFLMDTSILFGVFDFKTNIKTFYSYILQRSKFKVWYIFERQFPLFLEQIKIVITPSPGSANTSEELKLNIYFLDKKKNFIITVD